MVNSSIVACPLFSGIEEEKIATLLTCLSAKKQRYKKSSFIFREEDKAASVGIVVSGSVNVIQEDYWGNRIILAHIGSSGLFGEAYSCAGVERLPISVVASDDCEVVFLDYRKIITTCSAACVFHTSLISNMIQILANNNMRLTKKLEHLSKRSIREKLLSFLSTEAVKQNKSTIAVPFDRQELAEFLGVDRSALSRELSNMKKEGLVSYEKNKFILH